MSSCFFKSPKLLFYNAERQEAPGCHRHTQTMNSSPLCVFFMVTQPVVPLCKSSFSGRFMALLMDTGLLDSGATACVFARMCCMLIYFYIYAVMGTK